MIGFTLFIILLSNTAISQQVSDFKSIDKISYDLYLNSSWKELIITGEEALKQGVDYYYLRMRLGIASYELEDYSNSIEHFRQALVFNSADDVAKEYLYFSYKFYGREMEAHRVAQTFSRSLMRKYSYSTRGAIRSFSLNTTVGFIKDIDIIDQYSTDDLTEAEGMQSITSNFKLFTGGLEHDAGNILRFNHVVGYLTKNYMFYSQEEDETNLVSDARHGQFQYYLSGRLLLGNGTYLVPAFHYLNVKIPSEAVMVGRGRSSYTVEHNIFKHNVATSLGLERYTGKLKSGISAGYSNINEQQQLQGAFSLIWFPFGNLNLYSVSDITRYSVLPRYNNIERWILTQDLGFRAFPGLWMELRGRWGEMENFASSGALIVYNDIAMVKAQYGVTLIAPMFARRFELVVNYNYTLQENRFLPDINVADIPINSIETNYHIITGGIKWKF